MNKKTTVNEVALVSYAMGMLLGIVAFASALNGSLWLIIPVALFGVLTVTVAYKSAKKYEDDYETKK